MNEYRHSFVVDKLVNAEYNICKFEKAMMKTGCKNVRPPERGALAVSASDRVLCYHF